MPREIIMKAATVEEAIDKAAKALGVDRIDCEIELLETPRRALFGKAREAVIKATVADDAELISTPVMPEPEKPAPRKNKERPAKKTKQREKEEAPVEEKPAPAPRPVASVGDREKKLNAALSYLQGVIDAMGLTDVTVTTKEQPDGAVISLEGEGLAVLIGHHGETLDSLQYLTALACNRADNDYFRIVLDCGNYRIKREAALQSLANRMATKAKKTGRSQLLEPMNPYERRIIHAVVSSIEGVTSKSKGEEPNRRVVILPAGGSERPAQSRSGGNRGGRNRGNRNSSGSSQPKAYQPSESVEDLLKSEFKKREESATLYSKIEL